MIQSSLTLVGSGIKCLAHLTPEARTYIEQADKVLYLVNEPVMQEWIAKHNANAESLDELYFKYPLRINAYAAITDYILECVRKGQHVTVVFYGHPAVFAKPGLDAVRQAKKEGIDACILPGISAEDCLFADLLIDPGAQGCQSFEATDFLIYKRVFDTRSYLVLWQVGIVGALGQPQLHDNSLGIKILADYLVTFYGSDHQVIIYEAAQYPGFNCNALTLSLEALKKASISAIATLVIPSLSKAKPDPVMMKLLNL